MNMLSPFSDHSSERGSSLFIILFAVALFAALTYAISQQRNETASLSSEKLRLLAGDVMDMGNGLVDATSRLRLRHVPNTTISFENDSVAGYTNVACTESTCKIFAYDGGGTDWEKPSSDINQGTDWGFTGDIAIQDIGAGGADLVAVLPRLSETLCNQINIMIGLYGSTGSPPVVATVTANKFTGTYNATPSMVSGTDINGQKSACIKVISLSGTAVPGSPLSNTYVFYQVLESR